MNLCHAYSSKHCSNRIPKRQSSWRVVWLRVGENRTWWLSSRGMSTTSTTCSKRSVSTWGSQSRTWKVGKKERMKNYYDKSEQQWISCRFCNRSCGRKCTSRKTLPTCLRSMVESTNKSTRPSQALSKGGSHFTWSFPFLALRICCTESTTLSGRSKKNTDKLYNSTPNVKNGRTTLWCPSSAVSLC